MRNKALPSKATKVKKQDDLSAYLKKAYSSSKNSKVSHGEKSHHSPSYNPIDASPLHAQIGKSGHLFHRTTSYK